MENNKKIQPEIDRIIKQLNNFYNGNCWVADNVEDRLFTLPAGVALKKAEGHSHTVAEQVAHINAWRNFIVQKLTGNAGFDIIDNSRGDWPEATDWTAVNEEFKKCHVALIVAIKNFSVDEWNSTVPLRNYSFIFLINGIAEHDYYHYGQTGSLIAALKK